MSDLLRLERAISRLADALERSPADGPVEQVFRVLDGDGHCFSRRPCETCRLVTSVRGKPFGCIRLASQKERGTATGRPDLEASDVEAVLADPSSQKA